MAEESSPRQECTQRELPLNRVLEQLADVSDRGAQLVRMSAVGELPISHLLNTFAAHPDDMAGAYLAHAAEDRIVRIGEGT